MTQQVLESGLEDWLQSEGLTSDCQKIYKSSKSILTNLNLI
jgi:hypothetical protein